VAVLLYFTAQNILKTRKVQERIVEPLIFASMYGARVQLHLIAGGTVAPGGCALKAQYMQLFIDKHAAPSCRRAECNPGAPVR
jgi:hypothetical protein